MCTYNGEKYVSEQLESIIHQTLQPDEIIICDDCSSDHSVKIINEVMCNWAGQWRLVCNKKNLGYRKNFQQAISLCHGDFIFLSDQDDVWDQDKLAIEFPYFSDKSVILIFHDAEIVDEKLQQISPSFWATLGFKYTDFQKGDYSRLLRENLIQGASCAFRRELFELCQPPFPEEAIHDEWLGINAAFTGKIVPIHQSLLKYRQTGNNQIGAKRDGLKGKLKGWLKDYTQKTQKYRRYLYHQETLWKIFAERYPYGHLGKTGSCEFYKFLLHRNEAISKYHFRELPSFHEYKKMLNDPLEGTKQYIKDRLLFCRSKKTNVLNNISNI